MKTTHQISLPGGRQLTARSTPGEGVPVVFLHGLFGSSASWAEVCSGLDSPCIAIDLPGFGGSDAPPRPDVAAYAEDVAAALTELGIDRFELVGHSFGGAVAAALAERLPLRVVSLLLLAPAGFGRTPLASLGRRVCRGPERQATAALVAAGPAGAERYAGPVTALWGERDRVVSPSHGRRLVAALPQAHVAVLDGADHHLVSDRRDAIVDAVRTGRTPRRARRSRWILPKLRLGLGLTPRFA
jgi:pimeloyl-ACP methyl ester carboxylesterase